MSDWLKVPLLFIGLLMNILEFVTFDLALKNKLKPAVILTIIVVLLFIVGMWIMLSHGLILTRDDIIPKK
ncbi:hypothetical protein [Lactococcus lactis]|uniref:Uncharacterized protein n=1 Tax=Lactococcus lactis subsp. hordniae TaxID=203404 RepID=A0A5M9PUG6_LACLH|nr:hypothetical protein [Lactococcus lactis]KAA8698862.1 hypothetical protein F4V48_12395 [Lactococcus lactis subsp. hordniae]MCT3135627.1 hypothetical protein [Lactococcus lactis]